MLRPFLVCCGHKPKIDKFANLEDKLKKEISIVTVLKRIQKLTALQMSMYQSLGSEKIMVEADIIYRKYIS